MNESYQIQRNQKISGYSVQETTHQEKKHLIVPVTMIVEGVLNGSRGPLLHLAQDFGKFPDAWNGIPVVINHPAVNGKNVSANTPEIIDNATVGRVYNAHIDGNALKAEAWLNEEKLGIISPDVLSAVGMKQPIEVSVGVYTDEEDEPGTYNDREYTAIARNHRPDHLALLPCSVGACSIADGCGIRVNNLMRKGENNVMSNVSKEQLNQFTNLRYAIHGIVDNSIDGLKETLEKLRGLVDSLDTPSDQINENGVYHYLEEAFDTYLVYEQYSKEGEKYYKQAYQIDAGGSASLVGDPIEVEKKVDYVNVVQSNEQFIRTKISKKKDSMDVNERCTPCVKSRVDALIANAASGFNEDDRAVLETLTESVLDRMVPKAPPVMTVNDLSPEDQAVLAFGKSQMKAKKDGLIANILAKATEGVWTVETLEEMSDDMLNSIDKAIPAKAETVDYSLNGGSTMGVNVNVGKEELLLPAGFELKK
jgi:hypothetical protein